MAGCGDGRHRSRADAHGHQIVADRHRLAADAQIGSMAEQLLRDDAERADIQPETDRRKLRLECGKHLDQRRRWRGDVDCDDQVRFKPSRQPLGAGADVVQHANHAARVGEHRPAFGGERRFARAFPLEQLQPELRLQIGDRVADHRLRPVEPAPGSREAAGVRNGDQDLHLVECWVGLHNLSRFLMD